MKELGTPSISPSPSKPPNPWRIATVALVVLVGILTITVVLLSTSSPSTQTRVDWFNYEVTAGPGIVTNYTTIRGMCAPSDATSAGIFSMVWSTSTGRPVELVRLSALEGSTTPVIVNLYVALNASAGGMSFLTTYPTPCAIPWNLGVASNQTVTVTAIATLTYNVTAEA